MLTLDDAYTRRRLHWTMPTPDDAYTTRRIHPATLTLDDAYTQGALKGVFYLYLGGWVGGLGRYNGRYFKHIEPNITKKLYEHQNKCPVFHTES